MGQIKFSHISTGFIAVFIGYASAAAIIFQAATSAGASQQQIASWFWALGIGMGVTTILLSWRYKQPVVTAWSTPGAALLITSLDGLTVEQAVAIFLFSSLLITITGLTGIFDTLLKRIPTSIASAMLAGVLWMFGIGIFTSLSQEAIIIGTMLTAYIFAKPKFSNLLIPFILLLAVIMSGVAGKLDLSDVNLMLTQPMFITPDFDLASLLSVGIPLFVVTMASQNLPGFAVLKANGYNPPASRIITATGVTGLLLAPFGGFAFNLAALTGAICMSPNADPNPKSRYKAALAMGGFYLLAGILGTTFVSLFSSVPQAIIITIAGLALLPTLANCLTTALTDETHREAALLTFLLTASGINFAGVGSAFWGLCLGLTCYAIKNWQLKAARTKQAQPTQANEGKEQG
ncbi:benzoate/H(+) symporter BenE family transporter [Vibrio kanaloae]|uniref:benzoate/H(+) symporter BenE family transporter n=1 Tax=Vibrio kanaloae TaxID=170673 RepID=UPI001EFCA00A|nr:benzoate/H(+) symporter BenE family transporter [Vibrio kanaloae]MCG9557220.1 benzoate/H(+) symporter BenE family transporter [Vibrio kanaloae]